MPSLPLSVVCIAFAQGFPAGALSFLSKQLSERAQVQVELDVLEPERRLQLLHALRKPHEGLSEPLDLVIRERALLHPAKRLALHQLAQELDQRQDELGEAALDLFRVGVDTARKRVPDLVERARQADDVAVRREHLVTERLVHVASAKLYGAHGPVQRTVADGCVDMKPATARSNAACSSLRTR